MKIWFPHNLNLLAKVIIEHLIIVSAVGGVVASYSLCDKISIYPKRGNLEVQMITYTYMT